jgi:hypothetical protein
MDTENHMVQGLQYDDVYVEETREPEEVQDEAWDNFQQVYVTEFSHIKAHIKNKTLQFNDVDDIESVQDSIQEILDAAEFWDYESFDFNFVPDVKNWIAGL